MTRKTSRPATPCPHRRRLLAMGATMGAGLPLLMSASQSALAATGKRVLAFRNLHTEERIETVYWDGRYRPEALHDINYVLRDFRTGDVEAIDVKLLDLLYALQRETRKERPFHVISGYRSPKTNAMLASNSNGVAKKSFHMKGMAIDIRLPDYDLRKLHAAAKALKLGGVGYYGKSGFIHVDVGPVRYW